MDDIWKLAQAVLKEDIDEVDYQRWITPLSYSSINNQSTLVLLAPSSFIKNWVLKHYLDSILEIVNHLNSSINSISIIISKTPQTQVASNKEVKNNQSDSSPIITNNNAESNKTEFVTSNLDKNYTFDNFVTDKTNELAYTAALKVSKDSFATINPLFIYGDVGLGKTHLMQAIAWNIITNNPNRKFLYLSAERFMTLFIQALRTKGTIDFKSMFRNTDLLMIDDFQFISGKGQTQEEFFYTFNDLKENRKQIVITADKSPSELDNIEERITSRLNSGITVNINQTSYELRLSILTKKVSQLKVDVDMEILEFLASTITSNIRELEGALKMIITTHELLGTNITLDMACHTIEDLIKHNRRLITVEDIQKKVATYMNISIVNMLSARRDKHIVYARHVAMYLTKHLTHLSLPDIGKKFGGKDHTTVLYSVKKLTNMINNNQEVAEQVAAIKKIIEKM